MGFLDSIVKLFRKKKSTIQIKEIKVAKKEKPKTEQKVKEKKSSAEIKNNAINKKTKKKDSKVKDSKSKAAEVVPLIEDLPEEEWDVSAHLSPKEEGKVRFYDVGLPTSILRGIYEIGFQYCTDIQSEILPFSIKGKDVNGRAQTGTGKTAAFLITILYRLIKNKPMKSRKVGAPRALIMAPTRELVMQIEKDAIELSKYTGAKVLSIFGGIDYDKQRDKLEDYVDIIVATPGRLLDYYKQKSVKLDQVEILVLDEADRMLDMGFLPDMRRIINATPKAERQTMLFSATLTPEIMRLASLWMYEPMQVEIEPEQITSADVQQLAYIVSTNDKFVLLYNLLKGMEGKKIMIFANRKDQVRRLTEKLQAMGFSCGMLTGDVNQSKRIRTLDNLRNSKIDILIATDVAGRGIHVDNVEVVFNYTLPEDPDDYVHRIGRTGRAGAKGLSISFASEEDSYAIPDIEEHIKESLNYVTPEDELLKPIPAEIVENASKIEKKKRVMRPRTGVKNRSRNPKRRV